MITTPDPWREMIIKLAKIEAERDAWKAEAERQSRMHEMHARANELSRLEALQWAIARLVEGQDLVKSFQAIHEEVARLKRLEEL